MTALRAIAALAIAMLLQGCPSSPSGGGSAGPDGEAPRATTFSKSFGGAGFDTARAAIGTADGGYAFAGGFDGEALYGDYAKLWINKLDANGNTQWQRTLGGSAGVVGAELGAMRRARPTPDGGSIIVGYTPVASGGFDATDMFVAKVSATGVLQWSRTHDSGPWTEAFASGQYGRGPQADDDVTDIGPARDGGYLMAATSVANVIAQSGQVLVNATSLVVTRLTADGDLIWQRRVVDDRFEFRSALENPAVHPGLGGHQPIVRATHDNGAIVALTLRSEGQTARVRFIRFDSGGVVSWQHDEEIETVGLALATDLTQTHDVDPADGLRDGIRDDGFIVTLARFSDIRGGSVVKLAQDGNVEWRRQLGSDDVELYAVDQLCTPRSSGGGFECDFVAAGAHDGIDAKAYAVRFSPLGATIVERRFDTGGVIEDVAASVDPGLFAAALRGESERSLLVLDKSTLLTRESFLSGDRAEHAELANGSGLFTFSPPGHVLRRYVVVPSQVTLRLEHEFKLFDIPAARANSIVEVAPDSFVVGGALKGSGWLLRITGGRVDWQRTIDDFAGDSYVYLLAKADDGAVLVAGSVYSGAYVAKVSADGALLWQSEAFSHRDEAITDLQALPDGGSIVVSGYVIARLDRDGRMVWVRMIRTGAQYLRPEEGRLYLDSVAAADDGGFVVARDSGFSGTANKGQVAVIKLDANGDTVWSRNYHVRDAVGIGRRTPIRRTPDGGYVMGLTEIFAVARDAPAPLDPFGESNVLLVKIDRDGNVQWSRSYGAFLDEVLTDLRVLEDGGLLLAGWSHSFGDNPEAWILRTGPDGLVAEGCNALLVSLPPAAFRTADDEAGQTVPDPASRAPRTMSIMSDTNLAPNTAEIVEARQCLGRANPPAPPPADTRFTLTVAQPGTQTGVVTSTPAGLVCGTAANAPPCSASFDAGTDVSLDVDPGSRDRFLRWEDCTEILPASAGAPRCRMRMSGDRTVRAVFGAAQDRFLLRMTVSGSGGVRSTEAGGIECGSAFGAQQRCEQLYDRFVAGSTVPNSVSLAVSSGVADFRGWGGDCAALGSAAAVNLTLDADKNCTATFDSNPGVANLDVVVIGADGVIIDDDRTVNCSQAGPDCQQSYALGTEIGLGVDLQATTAVLQSWGGDCAFAGNQRRLRLTMDGNKQCTATFAPTAPQPFALTVQKAGFAALVVSAPTGIDCGPACTAEFNSGQIVRLTATPAAPSGTISGWTGCDRIVTGTNGMPDCEVDMSGERTVQVRIE